MNISIAAMASALCFSICWTASARAIENRDIFPPPAKQITLDLHGDTKRPVSLKVVLALPPGPGPYPLVIWNHGSDDLGRHVNPSDVGHNTAVLYYLSREYAVGMPLMRGFGGSGGKIVSTACRLDQLGLNSAADIEAVINQLSKRPELDAHRIIVSGSSMGGWNALALGSMGDGRVAAIVNFHGGVRSDGCNNGDEALKKDAGSYGSRTQIPSLWIYGDNDQYWSQDLWHSMFNAYKKAGAPAQYLDVGPYRGDSHRLLSDQGSYRYFAGKLDVFLKELELPSEIICKQYLPINVPNKSNYAALDDIAAVPYLPEASRDIYRKFLSSPIPRAFVIAPGQGIWAQYGGFDPFARAMEACRNAGQICLPYAIDDEVVWSQKVPSPSPSNFAAFDDANAIPYVGESGRNGYKQFLTAVRPRAFIIAPDGSWTFTSGQADPVSSGIAACAAKGHKDCRAYAVEQSVVWSDTPPAAH